MIDKEPKSLTSKELIPSVRKRATTQKKNGQRTRTDRTKEEIVMGNNHGVKLSRLKKGMFH